MHAFLARLWQAGTLPALGRVSIRMRIAILVALALAASAATGGVFLIATLRTHAALEAQDGYLRLNDLVSDVQARALSLEVEAEQFVRQRDPRFAQAFRDDVAALMTALESMRAVPQAESEVVRVAQLVEGFQALSDEFGAMEAEAVCLGLGVNDGLRGRLADSVQAIEDELKMWPNASVLMQDMLQMRKVEKDFMLTGSESVLASHGRYSRQFDFALDGTALAPTTREDMRRLLAAYVADFEAFGAGTLALEGEVKRLRARQAALTPEVEAIHDFAHQGMTQAVTTQENVRLSSLVLVSVIGLTGISVFIIGGLLIAASIVTPLRRIEGAMVELAAGNSTIDIPDTDREDEVGDMARAVLVFKGNAQAMAEVEAQRETTRREAEAGSRQRVLVLAQHFENAVKSVAELVATKAVSIHETAGGIAGGGDGDRNSWSLAVAEAAERARSTVQAATEAARELTETVGAIAQQGAAVDQAVGTAIDELAVAEDRVRRLQSIASRIDDIVGLIGDVAQRTNMLALNASIEAQRAGDAGKGFAVVAGEVKRLALQTAHSTQEIGENLNAIQAATSETAAAIDGVGAAIRKMEDLASVVRDSLARQDSVTGTIRRCVADVSAETITLSEGVTAFTHSAAQQCGAAAQVLWDAEDISLPTRQLKDEVDSFLATVRGGDAGHPSGAIS